MRLALNGVRFRDHSADRSSESIFDTAYDLWHQSGLRDHWRRLSDGHSRSQLTCTDRSASGRPARSITFLTAAQRDLQQLEPLHTLYDRYDCENVAYGDVSTRGIQSPLVCDTPTETPQRRGADLDRNAYHRVMYFRNRTTPRC